MQVMDREMAARTVRTGVRKSLAVLGRCSDTSDGVWLLTRARGAGRNYRDESVRSVRSVRGID